MNDSILYRYARGQYETDFSFAKPGTAFPPLEVRERNACYRYYHRLYDGTYGLNKKLIALINSVETEIPYKCIPINMFKLVVNKLDGLFFNNELIVKTGDIDTDEQIMRLIEKTNFVDALREAFKLAEINGDSCLKTYKDGCNAFSPRNCFKVVNEHNTDDVIAYVCYEYLTETVGNNKVVKAVRFEVHQSGSIFEQVFGYNGSKFGGQILEPMRYRYENRWIPRQGREYKTGVDDCPIVHWFALNKTADGVYGQTSLLDFKDIIFTLEARLSSEVWIEDNHEKPFLILGSEMFVQNEDTGKYELKSINGKYFVSHGSDSVKPEYLTWDGKLENSAALREDLMSYFYELSELGKTFISGEYGGNISEETLKNTIKSAIDRGNRDLMDFYYSARDALYTLCILNGIQVNKDNITLEFNVGRSDDEKVIADVVKELHEAGVFSMSTLRARFYGFNNKQSDEEDSRILAEKGRWQQGNNSSEDVNNNGGQKNETI